VTGAVSVGLGAILQVVIGGSKPAPEDVLCSGAFATAVPTIVVAGPLSAEHTFSETTGGDLLAKERERVRDTMIAQFIEILKEVRSRGTKVAAPTPQAP
jgi:predicted nucleic acid-binding Zn ribbon protein